MANGRIVIHPLSQAAVVGGGYSITITESAQAFCGGTSCQCSDCVQLNCPMTWTTFAAQCSPGAGVCNLYYPGGQCSFSLGKPCTLTYGVCSVTATAG